MPAKWVAHANLLDEIWVPSRWQKEVFSRSGVSADKVQVMPAAVDTHVFDPAITKRAVLPGTVVDLPTRTSPAPFVFLSIFKMEDRKGWQQLVSAFMQEFEGEESSGSSPVLLLHTYLHRAGPSGNVHNKTEILAKIHRHLRSSIGWSARDGRRWPAIEVHSGHLPGSLLPGLYKLADAFVLPTHAEGWGLPLMEAMAMGLPVISTNWGGSTEFMTNATSYLIDTEDRLISTPRADAWLGGFLWAMPRAAHLRALMRHVRANPGTYPLILLL